MSSANETMVEAAGGAVWRDAADGSGVELAVVHRPRYNDWSLPKGKLNPGEHPLAAAHREVLEETGFRTRIGAPLGETRYLKDGQPKRVRYWAMEAVGGEFAPNGEVDEVVWLSPQQARIRLSPDRDRAIAARLTRLSHTWPCVILRHASAGERQADLASDRQRPLDEVGQRQARTLVPVLAAFGITRIFTADLVRCWETVATYADAHHQIPHIEPLLAEDGVAADPAGAKARIAELAALGEPTLACSQRRAVRVLVAAMLDTLGLAPAGELSLPKSGFWALHVRADPVLHLVAAERFAGLHS